ncbi:double zinc ribbon domain-containing protein [Haloarchaeobius salinus]|uniref:double zinc ribbon domain-containing protein n=1 Tax=Haloarchaeobius salinus TaxID=1198298 RepID=UPI0021097169|nr:zinc ribbon domain-containing protein [Haloarchaeobius salinus]
MSKITVRADDELVERLEAREESKSQLVREALRAYLDDGSTEPSGGSSDEPVDTLDGFLAERVTELVDERVEHHMRTRQQDVNVNLRLEGATAGRASVSDEPVATPEHEGVDRSCGQCGEELGEDHVYCPNCGEKASRRVFCDCGDEIRSDWAFCPGCGRRTPAADVLDST